VSAHDPVSLATAVALVMAAGLGASSVPALRATRVDPMLALRRE
jgi:ABC-type antimicrobial peptide transport system permease subunit